MRHYLLQLILLTLVLAIISARVKRHLVFPKGSKLFLRINVRENLLKKTTIFTYAVGFRMNFDLPDKVIREGPRKRLHRRDIYQGLQNLMDHNDLDGRACVSKFLCEAQVVLNGKDDLISKLYKSIFTPRKVDKKSGYEMKEAACQATMHACPLSILHLVHTDHVSVGQDTCGDVCF